MAAVIRRYELTDEEREHIKPYIPEEQTTIARILQADFFIPVMKPRS